jgi:CheY-like chemotaxis protein
MAGWTILDRLKHDAATRHIPVHVISGDENRRRGLALGAMTCLEKSAGKDNLNAAFDSIHHSIARRVRKLLLIVGERSRPAALQELVGGKGVEVVVAASGVEGRGILNEKYFDCIAIGMDLADVPVPQLIEEIESETGSQTPPIVVLGGEETGRDMEPRLRALSRHSVVRYANAPERLLEETVLFLHRAQTDLSETQLEILAASGRNDRSLSGKKVLVVDDDVRNIFALTTVLEQHNLLVIHAENGRAGIEALLNTPGVDGVLMDIMMPEMDGYQTMRAIRQIPELRTLPIIAVTAKAMKGDRAKCIEAGASDYITKPVDLDQLFSVLRVWLGDASETTAPSANSVTVSG